MPELALSQATWWSFSETAHVYTDLDELIGHCVCLQILQVELTLKVEMCKVH